MQLIPTFSTLLSILILAVSLQTHIHAVPTTPPHDLPSNTTLRRSHLSARVPPQQAPQQPPPAIVLPVGIIGRDALYYTQLNIGTNPRPFNLVIDSGSQTFWVNSESQRNLGTRNGIGPHSSTTFTLRQPPKSWSTSYADDSGVSGKVARDTVHVRGTAVLPNFSFGTGETLTGIMDTLGGDGVIGFSVGPSRATGAPTLVEALTFARLIPAAKSGWKLPRLADGGQGGEIMLGGVNPALFVPPLVTVPADRSARDWRIRIDGVSVQGVQVAGQRTGILDSGANVIGVPSADAAALHAHIADCIELLDGNFLIPCDSRPLVVIGIGANSWPMRASDLVGDEVVHPEVPQGMCRSRIEVANTRKWLVGSPFLKNVYHVLDVTARKVIMLENSFPGGKISGIYGSIADGTQYDIEFDFGGGAGMGYCSAAAKSQKAGCNTMTGSQSNN
ncbi:hypothetical protein EVG20_g8611 [Dentipellis fragilis]|uniref:Peptidase A1 domain-containing protein n=1 Tax=Dentipellis fragilis TaxID=205917 RepID=A0A4Y9Y8W7_9AGAM|nr:hypothetical protein EVG20_g8611 [Dentipellis fragilis]